MYRTILAAVNEHVNSEIAGRYAMHLAAASGAKLLLCSIHEPGQPEAAFELAKDAARRIQHQAGELGVEADCLFAAGDPVRRLHDIIGSARIDLLFAAMRRREARRLLPPGRHAARKLLRFPCSVALVRVVHLGRIHPHEILIPLKGRIRHLNEHAEFSALLAKAFDARVHLLHVSRPPMRFFHGEQHLTHGEWEQRVPPDIARFMAHLDGYGIEQERRLSPGTAARSITIEAASRRRDLIVMGASERSILDFLRGGDPVKEVLRETPCNVIIFKPGM